MKRTTTTILLALALAVFSLPSLAQSTDDFGVWGEIGFEKELNKYWSLDLGAEFRTEQNSQKMNRWGVNMGASFKAHKYLKLSLGYNVLNYYNNQKVKDWDKTGWDPDPNDGSSIETYRWGYTQTQRYWNVRHRITFDLSSSFRICSWLRMQLRERYQFTHRESEDIPRIKVHNKDVYELDMQEQWTLSEEGRDVSNEIKHYDSENSHYLRSRVKLEVDKKKLRWSPFVSAEVCNAPNLSMQLDKVRVIAGTAYKFNKHHSLSLAYVGTFYRTDLETLSFKERLHAVSVGYEIKY